MTDDRLGLPHRPRPSGRSPGTSRAAETLGYVGLVFLVTTYYSGLRDLGDGGLDSVWVSDGALLAGLGFVVVGMLLHASDGLGRLSGALLLLGGIQIALGTAAVLIGQADFSGDGAGALVGAIWLLVAAIGRARRPALSTQLGVLLAATLLAVEIVRMLNGLIIPALGGVSRFGSGGLGFGGGLFVAIANTAWMCLFAGLLVVFAEVEGRTAMDIPGAPRRATLTRVWAAATASLGTLLAVSGTLQTGIPSTGGIDLHAWERDGIGIAVTAGLLFVGVLTSAGSYFVFVAIAFGAIALDIDAAYLFTRVGTEPTLLMTAAAILVAAALLGAIAHRVSMPNGNESEPAAPLG